MKKLPLGLLVGIVLGLLDGLSGFLSPEARDMMTLIIVSATAKGAITGLMIAVVAGKMGEEALVQTILVGGALGAVLSTLAAIPSGAYVEIVVPGTIIGLLLGLTVSKWGR